MAPTTHGITAPRNYVRPSTKVSAALLILFAVAASIPLALHLSPVEGMGPRMLPLFYAPLLAGLLLRLPIAVAVAALAPPINHLVTGLPPSPLLPGLVIQIGIFVVVIRLLHTRNWLYLVPVAYLTSLAGSAIASLVTDLPTIDFIGTLSLAWPGVVAMTLMGGVAQRALR